MDSFTQVIAVIRQHRTALCIDEFNILLLAKRFHTFPQGHIRTDRLMTGWMRMGEIGPVAVLRKQIVRIGTDYSYFPDILFHTVSSGSNLV